MPLKYWHDSMWTAFMYSLPLSSMNGPGIASSRSVSVGAVVVAVVDMAG
jgi:hypothetical protein